MKYFVTLSFGIVSCEGYDVIEASSLEEAEREAYEMCVEHAQAYGFEQDEDHFGDLDSVGREWDKEDYAEQGFIDPSVELYIPKKHDGYL